MIRVFSTAVFYRKSVIYKIEISYGKFFLVNLSCISRFPNKL